MEVYLDNNRMTKVDAQVKSAIEPLLSETYGELHALGSSGAKSRKLYFEALEKLYASIHAPEDGEIFITSGLAENSSSLLMSIYTTQILTGRKNSIIVGERDNLSILEGVKFLESQGCKIHRLPYNSEGVVDVSSLYDYITPRTALVSLPIVDSESGAINPVEEIAEICKKYEVPFHCDATNAIGKIPVDIQSIEPDFLSFSSETLHAPSGVGAFWVKDGVEFNPTIFGARSPYERHRGGPINLIGAVGLAKAVELASDALDFEMEDTRELRDYLEEELTKIEGVNSLISWGLRVPNTLLVTIRGLQSEMVLFELNRVGIEAYSYTIYPYGNHKQKNIVDVLGLDENLRHSTVGFALSRFTTKEEIDYVIKNTKEIIEYLRSFSSVNEEVKNG